MAVTNPLSFVTAAANARYAAAGGIVGAGVATGIGAGASGYYPPTSSSGTLGSLSEYPLSASLATNIGGGGGGGSGSHSGGSEDRGASFFDPVSSTMDKGRHRVQGT